MAKGVIEEIQELLQRLLAMMELHAEDTKRFSIALLQTHKGKRRARKIGYRGRR